MSDFITFRELDADNQFAYYILQKDFPHYVGVIYPFPKKKVVEPSPIAGYNLWVSFNGTLRGNAIPSYNHFLEEIVFILDRMANWYLQQRIIPDYKRYKKFKINDTISSK
jgi:hypothetical protein